MAPARRRNAKRSVPDATVSRLPVYLRSLVALQEAGVTTVSSRDLASRSGVTSAQLRKDLSFLGSYGRRGVGYEVAELRGRIEERIGLAQRRPVVIIGAGKLGRALADYAGLDERGFWVAALLDNDPAVVGTSAAGVPILDVEQLEAVMVDLAEAGPCIGVVATPAPVAQQVAERLVAAGVSAILSFAPTPLTLSPEVDVRRVDLAVELQILAFHLAVREAAGPSAASLLTGTEARAVGS